MRLCTNAKLWTGGHLVVNCRDRVGRAGVNASLRSIFNNTTGANDQNNHG
jgi:hypothetical protein